MKQTLGQRVFLGVFYYLGVFSITNYDIGTMRVGKEKKGQDKKKVVYLECCRAMADFVLLFFFFFSSRLLFLDTWYRTSHSRLAFFFPDTLPSYLISGRR